MKGWWVFTKRGTVLIGFEEREERQARAWMADHAHFAEPGGTMEGMELRLHEWETAAERIEREHAERTAALREIQAGSAPVSPQWQIADRALHPQAKL